MQVEKAFGQNQKAILSLPKPQKIAGEVFQLAAGKSLREIWPEFLLHWPYEIKPQNIRENLRSVFRGASSKLEELVRANSF